MKYTIKEIEDSMRDSSDVKLQKAHEIFRDLKKHINNNDKLDLHEIEHFCNLEFIGYEKGFEGFDIHSYPICEDYWFEWAYREYWMDLHGIRQHTFALTGKEYSTDRVQSDLNKLQELATEWEKIIEKLNHTDITLAEISKETRLELKNHKKKPIFNYLGFFRMCFNYEYEKLVILLRSKYIFQLTREFFHYRNADSLKLHLGKRVIEFTSNSLIHILSRHYEFSKKYVNRDKSFHIELIQPRKIYDILDFIFKQIDEHKLSCIKDDKIYFEYERVLFTVWISKAQKQIKGKKGNFEYERIASFYPTENNDELEDIQNNYSKENCNETTSIYYKISPHKKNVTVPMNNFKVKV